MKPSTQAVPPLLDTQEPAPSLLLALEQIKEVVVFMLN